MTKRDELIALGGVVMKVRELGWVEMPDRDPESASWIAETDLGMSYRVFAAWWGAQNKYGYVFDGFYHTENEAKAAAQADYEQRILSALEAPAAGDGEPVAWRWQEEGWGDYWIYNPEPGWLAEQNNIVKQPLYTAPPADAGMREALDAEERYLLDHFGSEADIMPGDVSGAFHRLREALTAPGATTKSDGGEPSSRTAGGFPVAAAPYHAEETGVIQPTRERAGIERGMDQGVTGGESAITNSSPSEPKNYFFENEEDAAEAADNGRNTGGKSYYRPSDPSSTRSEVAALTKRLDQVLKVMRGARNRSEPMAVWADDIKAVEDARAQFDQFEIRRE